MNRLHELLEKLKQAEQELIHKFQKKEKEMHYNILDNKVCFDKEVINHHKSLATRIHIYIMNAPLMTIITMPIIWFCIFPAVFMDAAVTIYHAVCFPIYGIPKVKRSDYILMDRQAMHYLNLIEKLNCLYCGYFNGLIAYIQEIAARSEQYSC